LTPEEIELERNKLQGPKSIPLQGQPKLIFTYVFLKSYKNKKKNIIKSFIFVDR
jgi:hypothetical protein